MTVFEIPTQSKLTDEFKFRISGYINKIRMITNRNYDLYEMRFARRVEKQLKELSNPESDVIMSYGLLKELSEYCYDGSCYFQDKRCRKVMRDLSSEINSFCEFHYHFLL